MCFLLKKKNEGRILSVVLLLVFVLSVKTSISFSEEVNMDKIVAVVNGEEIKYKEIAKKVHVVSKYKTKNEKLPEESKLNEEILSNEKKALITKIHALLKSQKIAQLNITVSEKEIDKEIENIFSKISPKATQEANRKISVLTKALRKVLKNPDRDKEVYEKDLAMLMSYEEWKAHRMQIDSIAKVELLEKELPITVEKEKRNVSREYIKNLLLDKKLEQYITSDIFVEDEELKRFLREEKHIKIKDEEHYGKMKALFKKEFLERKKRERLDKWRQSVFKESQIEIKDYRFKDITSLFQKRDKNTRIEEIRK
jgi:hypothetical protein